MHYYRINETLVLLLKDIIVELIYIWTEFVTQAA